MLKAALKNLAVIVVIYLGTIQGIEWAENVTIAYIWFIFILSFIAMLVFTMWKKYPDKAEVKIVYSANTKSLPKSWAMGTRIIIFVLLAGGGFWVSLVLYLFTIVFVEGFRSNAQEIIDKFEKANKLEEE